MRRSTDRILVSHAGNLPRPGYLDELIDGGKMREGANQKAYADILPKAVKEIVDRQIELGVDIVNDGEYAKAGSYGGYIHDRVTGYEMVPADPNRKPKRAGTAERDRRDFPGFFASGLWFAGSGGPIRPGFATPGEVQQHQRCREHARLHRARSRTSATTSVQVGHRQPQGRARGQGRRGLHRRARAAKPRRRRAQRVLQERRGVHDGRRRGGARGVQGDHRRRLHRPGRRAGVLHLLVLLPGLDRRGVPQVPRASASTCSTTASRACPRS